VLHVMLGSGKRSVVGFEPEQPQHSSEVGVVAGAGYAELLLQWPSPIDMVLWASVRPDLLSACASNLTCRRLQAAALAA